jgi:hypothetical protein
MKKKNKFGYLSLLGLLGFLGFVTDHHLLFLFFGYFGYAFYFNVIADEMFKEHLLKASAISFFILLFVMMITIILVTITRNMEFAHWGLFLGFIIGNLSFAVFHAIYEIKESNGAKDENI